MPRPGDDLGVSNLRREAHPLEPIQDAHDRRRNDYTLSAPEIPHGMAGILEPWIMWKGLKTFVLHVRRHVSSRLMVNGLLVGVVSL